MARQKDRPWLKIDQRKHPTDTDTRVEALALGARGLERLYDKSRVRVLRALAELYGLDITVRQ